MIPPIMYDMYLQNIAEQKNAKKEWKDARWGKGMQPGHLRIGQSLCTNELELVQNEKWESSWVPSLLKTSMFQTNAWQQR